MATSLDFVLVDKVTDPDENFLLVEATIDKKNLILGAVYGPNHRNRYFFDTLENGITRLQSGRNLPVVLGGDWNATVVANIDAFQMAGLPNRPNSERLSILCNSLALTDPYRILYPDKLDFSYQPFGNVRLNRSRINFFCFSRGLIPSLLDCSIGSSPLISNFDHKHIVLNLGKPIFVKKDRNLSNQFLNSKILDLTVRAAAIKTHLTQAKRDSRLNRILVGDVEVFLDRELRKVQRIRESIVEFFDLDLISTVSPTEYNLNMASGMLGNIEDLIMECTDLTTLEELEKSINHNDFFEKLAAEIRKAGI